MAHVAGPDAVVGAAGRSEYERLVRFLLAPERRFALAVATSQDAEVLAAVRRQARAEADAAGLRVAELDAGAMGRESWLLDALTEAAAPSTAGRPDVLFVFGLDPLLLDALRRDDPAEAIRGLNRNRDLLAARASVRLILWLSDDGLGALSRAAPDLVDFVLTEFRFLAPERERILTAYADEPMWIRSAPPQEIPGLEREAALLMRIVEEPERSDEARADAAQGIGVIQARLGDRPQAEAWLVRAAASYRAANRPEEASRVYRRLGQLALTAGELERAGDYYRRGLHCLGDSSPGHLRADLLSGLADLAVRKGDWHEGLRISRDEVLPIVEADGDERDVAVTRVRIATILHRRGEVEDALGIYANSLAVFESVGDHREMAVTKGKIAEALEDRGDWDEALRIRRDELLPMYERQGDSHGQAVVLSAIADGLQRRGFLDQAQRVRLEQVLPMLEQLGVARDIAITKSKMADVYEQRGDLDEALRLRQQEVLPLLDRLGGRDRALILCATARLNAVRGRMDDALRLFREALPVLQSTGDARAIAVVQGDIADAVARRGDLDEAERILRTEVLPVFERLGLTRELAIAQAKLATLLQEHGQFEGAIDVLQQVVTSLDELGRVTDAVAARTHLARALLARGQRDDRGRAVRILNEAEVDATAGRLAPALSAIAELRASLRGEESEPLSERRVG